MVDKNKKLICFRPGISETIGTGHFRRCLILANEMKEHEILFFVEKSGVAENILSNYGLRFHQLLNHKNDLAEIEEIKSFLKSGNLKPDLFLIDHYGINSEYEKLLAPLASKIAVIDDLEKSHYCDIFINWNVYADKKSYAKLMLKPDTKMLVGKEYLVIDERYKKATESKNKKSQPKKILIFFTGGNCYNMTMKTIRALENLPVLLEVVIGNLNPSKNKIVEYCRNKNNINLHIQTEEMPKIMADCDLAVGSFGQNSYERLYLGLYTIGVILADNQLQIAGWMDKNGYAINLGNYKNVTGEVIKNSVVKNLNNHIPSGVIDIATKKLVKELLM